MTVAAIFIKLFELCLQSPVIRGFIEGLALKIAADFWYHPAVQDDFKPRFDLLMAKLAVTADPAEKQNVLKEIQGLRAAAIAQPLPLQPSPPATPHA